MVQIKNGKETDYEDFTAAQNLNLSKSLGGSSAGRANAAGDGSPHNVDVRRKTNAQRKIKFALRMSPETQQLVKEMYPRDNCRTQNEFIEKAIRFYSGYVSGQDACEFLPASLTTAMRGTIHESENRVFRESDDRRRSARSTAPENRTPVERVRG